MGFIVVVLQQTWFGDFGGFAKLKDQWAISSLLNLVRNMINLWLKPNEKAWSVNTQKRLVVFA
jgi:hypothetical protein